MFLCGLNFSGLKFDVWGFSQIRQEPDESRWLTQITDIIQSASILRNQREIILYIVTLLIEVNKIV